MSSLEQRIEKKAKSGFEVWQHTVDMTKGELPPFHNAEDLNAKIKEIRKRKIWAKLSDVFGLLPNYVIRSKQELLDELDKFDEEVKKSSHGWNILSEEEKIRYAFICELLDVHCPKCKSNDVHRPRVKAKGTKYECLQCGETW